MLLIKSVALATLVLCTVVELSTEENTKPVIYVDMKNGTLDSSCWKKGLDLPCRNLELAIAGARKHNSTIDVLPFEVSAAASQEVQPYSHSCPPWFFPDHSSNDTCRCGKSLHGVVKCNETLQESAILDCYCMTYNESTGVVAGPCFYNCENIPKGQEDTLYHPLPRHVEDLNSAMCGHLHRGGQLCGSCEEGYSPLVYSYDIQCFNCTDSHYNWVKYVTAAFVPLTVFYVIVLMCRVSATSPQLYAFVNFSQNIAVPANVRVILAVVANYPRLGTWVRVIVALYGIWNLDFFRALIPHICLEVNTLQALALDYAIACYPLLLIVVSYVLIELHARDFKLLVYFWRPFRRVFISFRKQWDIKTSIIEVFATFLLLSNFKFLSVSFDLLTPTEVHNVNGSLLGLFLWYDASIAYFGKEHLPYGILALLLLFIFVIFPIVLLLLYPMRCFQWCLGRCSLRSHALRIFMDAFQGCYKDGTNGTRDCRYFAALYLMIRIVFFFVLVFTLNVFFYAVCLFVLIVFAMLIAIIQPYKAEFATYNIVDTVFILILALLFCGSLCMELASLKDHRYTTTSKVATGIVAVLPLLYITAITLHWVCSRTKIGRNMIRKIQGCAWLDFPSLQLQDVNDVPHRLSNPEQYRSVAAGVTENSSCSSDNSSDNETEY